jgi:hypothetical protein
MELQDVRFVPGIHYSRWFVVWGFVFSNVAAYSQSTFGDIRGTARDPGGLAVPQAVVTLLNLDENTTRMAPTDDNGSYLFENLKPGHYQVSADKPGFAKSSTISIDLVARQSARIDITFSLQQVQQTVSVEAEAEQINYGE